MPSSPLARTGMPPACPWAAIPIPLAGLLRPPSGPPTLQAMTSLDRIVVDPEIRFGKPTVRGTRLTVGEVLGYLADLGESKLLKEFPQLAAEDIKACLAYAAERERRSLVVPAT